jgi:hypothetical protein
MFFMQAALAKFDDHGMIGHSGWALCQPKQQGQRPERLHNSEKHSHAVQERKPICNMHSKYSYAYRTGYIYGGLMY